MTRSPLLPVAEAQARLLALATPLPAETVVLADAAGRWSAEDVFARRTQPAADLSAMDGYAVRFADMPGPWRVSGEATPGREPSAAVGAGEAMRIFTGAPLPPGADSILIQEDAARDGERLTLTGGGPAVLGQHVRRAGSDFAAGALLITRGERLTPARIGLAAIGGHGMLAVARRPRVALISTGDELVPPGEPTPGVRLPSSNAPMLAAQLGPTPAIVEDRGIVPDDADALARAFDSARSADIIVTSGGASVGDHDLVKPVLERLGARLDFWKVAMRPGKPLLAGRLGDAIVLGLPGNPVSAFVTAELFLKPLIAAFGGAARPIPEPLDAILAADVPEGGDRAEYLRARLENGRVHPILSRDSAMLAVLASANALLVRDALAPPARVGDPAKVIPLA